MRPLSGHAERLLYGLLSISGISLWFLAAFPFANHNESYTWVAELNHLGPLEMISEGISPVSSPRPLGVMTAWLTFKLSGGSIYPQQIFNYLIALLAWLLLYEAIPEKRTFSWVSLVAGAAFFSGYVYLFHLHGVFYSPLLVYTAILLASAIAARTVETKSLVIISILAPIASLYHPFALLFYAAYLLGYLVENLHKISQKKLVAIGLLIAATFVLMRLLVPSSAFYLDRSLKSGLLTSYRTMEVNRILSMVAVLLSLGTVASVRNLRKTRVALICIVSLLSLAFWHLGLPILIIWVAVSFVKAALAQRWRIAFILAAAAVLPAATGTGSPTYVVFVVICCCCIFAYDLGILNMRSVFLNSISAVAVSGIFLIGIALRAGLDVPIVSRFAAPLLAEKEKTFQLEQIIRWWAESDLSSYRLLLARPAGKPAKSSDAIDRIHRAPTSQDCLDVYLTEKTRHLKRDQKGELVIGFGGDKIEGGIKVYAAPGKYAGEAAAYIMKRY